MEFEPDFEPIEEEEIILNQKKNKLPYLTNEEIFVEEESDMIVIHSNQSQENGKIDTNDKKESNYRSFHIPKIQNHHTIENKKIYNHKEKIFDVQKKDNNDADRNMKNDYGNHDKDEDSNRSCIQRILKNLFIQKDSRNEMKRKRSDDDEFKKQGTTIQWKKQKMENQLVSFQHKRNHDHIHHHTTMIDVRRFVIVK